VHADAVGQITLVGMAHISGTDFFKKIRQLSEASWHGISP
jgi:hypothetical protein